MNDGSRGGWRRILRVLLWSGLTLLMLFTAATVWIAWRYPPETWKPLVLEQLRSRTGFEISFRDLEYAAFSLRLKGVRLKRNRGESSLKVEAVRIRPDFAALLRGKLVIGSLEMLQATGDLHLSDFTGGKKKKSGSRVTSVPGSSEFPLRNISCVQCSLHTDHPMLSRVELTLSATPGGIRGSVKTRLHSRQVSLQLDWKNSPAELLRKRDITAIRGKTVLRADDLCSLLPGGLSGMRCSLHAEMVHAGATGKIKDAKLSGQWQGRAWEADFSGEVSFPELNFSGRDLRLKTAGGSVGAETFRITNRKFSGTLAVNADLSEIPGSRLSGSAKGSVRMENNRLAEIDLDLNDGAWPAAGNRLVSGLSGGFTLKKGELVFQSRSAEILGIPLKLKIESDFPPANVKVSASGKEISLDDLREKLSGSGGGGGGGKKRPLIRGDFSFETVKLRGFSFTDASGEFELAETLKVSAKSHFAGGNLRFDATGGGLHADFSGVKPAALGHLFPMLEQVDGRLEGKLEWQGSSSAGDFRIQVISRGGKIQGLAFQKYLQGLLSPARDKLAVVQFSRAEAELERRSGTYYLKNFNFTGPTIAILLGGKWEKPEDAEMAATLKLSRSLVSSLANPLSIPLEDQLQGDWYVLPFSCSGNFQTEKCWRREF